jgi:hypothetical protein
MLAPLTLPVSVFPGSGCVSAKQPEDKIFGSHTWVRFMSNLAGPSRQAHDHGGLRVRFANPCTHQTKAVGSISSQRPAKYGCRPGTNSESRCLISLASPDTAGSLSSGTVSLQLK